MFPTCEVGNFRLSDIPPVWEMSDMAEEPELEGETLYDAFMAIKPTHLAETEWAEQAGVNRGFFGNLKKKSKNPRRDTVLKLLRFIDKTEVDLRPAPTAPRAGGRLPLKSQDDRASPDEGDDALEMVGIQHIDMAYGLGTTFAVDYPEIEVMQFPKAWIQTITHAPPQTLTWTRGKGDSMEPTIRDGDLVLLDRSQRVLTERDAMWAFTIGEEAAIKRLRKQGEICEIFSDNPNVPPDKQPLRDMNIVGRVVFVGSRK